MVSMMILDVLRIRGRAEFELVEICCREPERSGRPRLMYTGQVPSESGMLFANAWHQIRGPHSATRGSHRGFWRPTELTPGHSDDREACLNKVTGPP